MLAYQPCVGYDYQRRGRLCEAVDMSDEFDDLGDYCPEGIPAGEVDPGDDLDDCDGAEERYQEAHARRPVGSDDPDDGYAF